MNIEDKKAHLKDSISAMKASLKAAKEQLAELEGKEPKLWIPDFNEGYFVINEYGTVTSWLNESGVSDMEAIQVYNAFETAELAKAQAKRDAAFREYNAWADKLGRCTKRDKGHEIWYHRDTDALLVCQDDTTTAIFKTEEDAKYALTQLSNNCKAWLKGEI